MQQRRRGVYGTAEVWEDSFDRDGRSQIGTSYQFPNQWASWDRCFWCIFLFGHPFISNFVTYFINFSPLMRRELLSARIFPSVHPRKVCSTKWDANMHQMRPNAQVYDRFPTIKSFGTQERLKESMKVLNVYYVGTRLFEPQDVLRLHPLSSAIRPEFFISPAMDSPPEEKMHPGTAQLRLSSVIFCFPHCSPSGKSFHTCITLKKDTAFFRRTYLRVGPLFTLT